MSDSISSGSIALSLSNPYETEDKRDDESDHKKEDHDELLESFKDVRNVLNLDNLPDKHLIVEYLSDMEFEDYDIDEIDELKEKDGSFKDDNTPETLELVDRVRKVVKIINAVKAFNAETAAKAAKAAKTAKTAKTIKAVKDKTADKDEKVSQIESSESDDALDVNIDCLIKSMKHRMRERDSSDIFKLTGEMELDRITNVALQMALSQFQESMTFTKRLSKYEEKPMPVKLPSSIFGWSMKDCYDRRKIKRKWFKKLERSMDTLNLENYKFKIDVDNIVNIIQLATCTYLRRGPLIDILRYLQSCEKYLDYEESLITLDEYEKQLEDSRRNSSFTSYATMRLRKSMSECGDPIHILKYKYTYKKKYDMERINQTKLKFELAQQEIQSKINEYNEKYFFERICADQSALFSEIQEKNLNATFEYLLNMYEEKESIMMAEVEYLSRGIDKMKSEHKQCQEDMKRYIEEIYAVRHNIPIKRKTMEDYL